MPDAAKPNGQSFWTTGLGYLTQLGVVLGAVAGILAAVGALTGTGDSDKAVPAGLEHEQSAADVARYRQAIVDQCRKINAIERDRDKAATRIDARVHESTPITRQRDWVLGPLGDEIQATNHVRAQLKALTPPPSLAPAHEDVQSALKRLFDLLLNYHHDLRVAHNSRPAVSETILEMEDKLPDVKNDQFMVTSGLTKLAGPSACDIRQASDDNVRVLLPAVSAG